MKAELLKQGLATLTQVTNSPVMVAVKDNVLYLGGHSETSSVVMTADVDTDNFHYVLSSDHAKQLVKTLRTGPVVLTDDGHENLTVKNGKSTFTFATLGVGAVSYKLLVHGYKEDFFFTVDGELLNKALQTVLSFSSGDINDIRAKNIHLAITKDYVEVAASNGYTLASYKFPLDKYHDKEEFPLGLVERGLASLGRTFGKSLELGFSQKKVYYKSKDDFFTYQVTLLRVDHPPFPYLPLVKKLEDTEASSTIILDKDDLLSQTKSVLYFTDEKVKNRVRVSYTESEFLVEGHNDKGSFSLELVPISSSGLGSMFVSLDNLVKVASAVTSSEVKFKVVAEKLFVNDGMFSCVVPQLRN